MRLTGGPLKRAQDLEEIKRLAGTVEGHGKKIVEKAARMSDELADEVRTLDAQVAALKAGGEG